MRQHFHERTIGAVVLAYTLAVVFAALAAYLFYFSIGAAAATRVVAVITQGAGTAAWLPFAVACFLAIAVTSLMNKISRGSNLMVLLTFAGFCGGFCFLTLCSVDIWTESPALRTCSNTDGFLDLMFSEFGLAVAVMSFSPFFIELQRKVRIRLARNA
jgi:hypothetical protein